MNFVIDCKVFGELLFNVQWYYDGIFVLFDFIYVVLLDNILLVLLVWWLVDYGWYMCVVINLYGFDNVIVFGNQ